MSKGGFVLLRVNKGCQGCDGFARSLKKKWGAGSLQHTLEGRVVQLARTHGSHP